MKILKKALCTSLAVMSIAAGASLPSAVSPDAYDSKPAIVQMIDADAACAVTTGGFNGDYWSGYTYVYVKNPRKKAKIKVCAFNASGKIKSGKFKVRIATPQDYGFSDYEDVKGSGNITLNYGYSVYKIQICRNNPYQQLNNKKTNTNRANCHWWSIDAKSNCSF